MRLIIGFLLISLFSCKKDNKSITTNEDALPTNQSDIKKWNVIKNSSGAVQSIIALNDSTITISEFSQGIWTTINKGVNWSQTPISTSGYKILSFTSSGDSIYAGTDLRSVLFSANKGQTWSVLTNTITGIGYNYSGGVTSIKKMGMYLFIGTDVGLYRTTLNGLNMTNVTASLPATGLYQSGEPRFPIFSIEKMQNTLFISTFNGVYYSMNYGNSWSFLNTGLPSVSYNSNNGDFTNQVTKIIYGHYFYSLYAATNGAGVFRLDWTNSSSDLWQPINTGLSNLSILDLAFTNDSVDHYTKIYAITNFSNSNSDIYECNNKTFTENWSKMSKDGISGGVVNSIFASKTKIFIGTSSQNNVYVYE